MSTAGIVYLDQRATEEGLTKGDGAPNRSDLVRIMVAYAAARMPTGWRPPVGRDHQPGPHGVEAIPAPSPHTSRSS